MRVIRSIEELRRLPSDRRVNGMGPRELLRLEIPGLPCHAQIRGQQRLNRLQSRCGCVAGAVAMLASVVLGALRLYTRHASSPSWNLLWESLALLVAAFVIGFVAKMSVLAVTRRQFARECAAQYQFLDKALRGGTSDVHLHALGR